MPPRKKRPRPLLPALFDEKALLSFLIDHNCPEPAKSTSIVYRVAVRCLRNLPEGLSLSSATQTWIDNTRAGLLRRRDLPNDIAHAVCQDVAFLTTTLIQSVDSEDGNTSKLLVETHDGHRVEAVVLRRHGRNTSICVSSQIGCQMGCQFCATGTMGMIGNLTAAEILEQVVYHKLAPSSLRSFPLRNIIFMGMGEPLDNFSAVKAAVDGLTDFSRFGLSRARVTVSTVGVVPSMLKLNSELPGIPLALSLHAPNQTLRERIVPAAKAWSLDSLMAALDTHIYKAQHNEQGIKFTGVMIEYVLLSGVNDLSKHAVQLANLLEGKPVLINLIPYNPNITAEMYGFKAGTYDDAYAFGKILIERGLHARVRIERGSDIAAACGQLALTSASKSASKSASSLKESSLGSSSSSGSSSGGSTKNNGPALTISAVKDIEDLLGGLRSGKQGSRSGMSAAASIASSRASGKWRKRRRGRRSESAAAKEEKWDTGSNWTEGSQPQLADREGARKRHEARLQKIEESEQKDGKTLTWEEVEEMMGGKWINDKLMNQKKEKQKKEKSSKESVQVQDKAGDRVSRSVHDTESSTVWMVAVGAVSVAGLAFVLRRKYM